MELVATYPILYRSHQYEVGDSLPADDESMVQDWQGNPRTEKPRRM